MENIEKMRETGTDKPVKRKTQNKERRVTKKENTERIQKQRKGIGKQ
jgi:hypothetical protein